MDADDDGDNSMSGEPDENGEKKPVILGSYGIGITRAMGVIVEKFHDENGIIWPENVAPFAVHIVSIAKDESDEAYKKAEELYNELNKAEVEVLWDDRIETRPGEKFADSDLIGIPTRVVVSSKSLENGGYEIKKRNENNSKIVSKEGFFSFF